MILSNSLLRFVIFRNWLQTLGRVYSDSKRQTPTKKNKSRAWTVSERKTTKADRNARVRNCRWNDEWCFQFSVYYHSHRRSRAYRCTWCTYALNDRTKSWAACLSTTVETKVLNFGLAVKRHTRWIPKRRRSLWTKARPFVTYRANESGRPAKASLFRECLCSR